MSSTYPLVLLCLTWMAASTLLGCTQSVTPPSTPSTETPLAEATAKPDIIWILLDACRAENLSCYGYERPTTPNIDAIADRGVVFEQAYAQSNWTARSVPSYMTGRYFAVSSLEIGGRLELVRQPPPGERLLPEILSDNGFYTAMFSAHLAFVRPGCSLWRSFDKAQLVPFDRKERVKPNFAEVNALVLPWLSAATVSPYFLYLHTVDTHFPHALKEPDNQWIDPAYDKSVLVDDGSGQVYRRRDGQAYSEADKAYFQGLYDGSLHYVDRQIGELIKHLEALGKLENTIIIIGSDHGEALGEDGYSFEHTHGGSSDQVFRVPLIMAGPGIPNGVRVSSLVENVDIVPTLMDMLKLDTDAKPDGKSLVPLMHDPSGPPVHDYVFAYRIGQNFPHPPPYDDEPAIFVRSTSFKYDYDPTTGYEFLWSVPDDLRQRNNVIANNQKAAEELKKRWLTERQPLREAYLKLPHREIVIEGFNIARKASPQDAFVWWGDETNEVHQSDNKWTVQDRYIWSAGWKEETPTIRASVPVPNQRYNVAISTMSSRDLHGAPASSITIAMENLAPTTVTISALPSEQAAFELTNLGIVSVEDNSFDISLSKGLEGYWAAVGKLVITPIQTNDEDEESVSRKKEQQDAIDAGGYGGKPVNQVDDLKELEEALRSQGYL